MKRKNRGPNIVVEPPLYGIMQDLAAESGVSTSTLARDLIREALELRMEELSRPNG